MVISLVTGIELVCSETWNVNQLRIRGELRKSVFELKQHQL